jgi:hypothetical protein
MAQRQCQAAVPAECRYHGKFHRKLKKFIRAEQENFYYTPPTWKETKASQKIEADKTQPIGIRSLDDSKYELVVVSEQSALRGTSQEGRSITVEARSADRIPKALADRIHDPKTKPKTREYYEQLLTNLEAKGVQHYIQQYKAQQEVLGNNPHIDAVSWGITPPTVHTIHAYGSRIDQLPLPEEKKAILLNSALVRHESWERYDLSTGNEYVEQTAGVWSIYTDYKKSLAKIS